MNQRVRVSKGKTMSYIIRIVAPLDGSFKVHRNFYIRNFEPDTLTLTTLKREAKKFKDKGEALEFWGAPRTSVVSKQYKVEIMEDK